jgi:hypothetical protein
MIFALGDAQKLTKKPNCKPVATNPFRPCGQPVRVVRVVYFPSATNGKVVEFGIPAASAWMID